MAAVGNPIYPRPITEISLKDIINPPGLRILKYDHRPNHLHKDYALYSFSGIR
jgi:hypothetical protein